MTTGNNITGAFCSVLIANRGEIAVRVAKTLRQMGLRSVAIYSDADCDALHVRAADQSVPIGGMTAQESYLDIAKVIAAAKASGAEAVHPGYGFLSENAEFARACNAAGLIFIGPSPEAIALMGDKAAAKRHMRAAGVPCLPGYDGGEQSRDRLIAEGAAIGFPLMVKAAAGGGGRGMRLAAGAEDLPGAIDAARAEALSTFGSGDLILERAVVNPRHVEVQVFADAHGAAIHLGERDCSVQRRHQKVIEEAPCPVLSPEQRAEIGAISAAAARSIGYLGAGTMEFLLDESGDFYFLEMNTRLQVEHPVTEMITGIDLVELQVRAARGEPLGIAQEDVRIEGHSIEVRLYAEDPARDFAPGVGRLRRWHRPGNGVRIDAGLDAGQQITPYYDSMVAKLISHGASREEARARLVMALRENGVFGFTTNQGFLLSLLEMPDFAAGQATTAFVGNAFGEAGYSAPAPGPELWAFAAVTLFETIQAQMARQSVFCSAELRNWSSCAHFPARFDLGFGDLSEVLSVVPLSATAYSVTVAGTQHEVSHGPNGTLRIDGLDWPVLTDAEGLEAVTLFTKGHGYTFRRMRAQGDGDSAGGGVITAPMHGQVIELFTEVGATVEKGQRLFVLEAMKMQHAVLSDCEGIVSELPVLAPAQVAEGDVICRITIEEDR